MVVSDKAFPDQPERRALGWPGGQRWIKGEG
jgi:hypothetical protein